MNSSPSLDKSKKATKNSRSARVNLFGKPSGEPFAGITKAGAVAFRQGKNTSNIRGLPMDKRTGRSMILSSGA